MKKDRQTPALLLERSMFPIVLCLPSEDVAAARAVLRPWIENRTLARTEVFEIPTLAAVFWSVWVMRADAILIVRCLAVREDTLLVNRQPEPVTECGDCLRHALDLQRRW